MQEEVVWAALLPLFAQDRRDVRVGVTRVDAERDAGYSGGADMRAEGGLLHIPRCRLVEIVQAGLADPDHLRVVRKRGNLLGRRHGSFGSVLRVNADGAPHIRPGLGKCPDSERLIERGTDRDQLPYPGLPSAVEDLVELVGEIVEVAV